ncbi:unnamed protein product [Ceutorhynchus assimilis]|uniref:Uncharacterized protein n=1 Tax=Ceutorhynchus assimilis TaxID=467358 RepID=A0A9N9MPF5_9CUCU|nr:unnamed protein product [Ceutorhynchus assimilis]
MKSISLCLVIFCCGVALAVQYCSICAFGDCHNNVTCLDQGVSDAQGCISFWVDYGSGANLSYTGCWDPKYGTCEQIVEAEKMNGHEAGCKICSEDNCNAPSVSV